MKVNHIFSTWKSDLPAGIIVFLVALPLCLGIALASGAPLFSGLIAGVVGGIVVGSLSGSQLGVSGPAAGLAVIVLTAIQDLGAFEVFLLAVVIGGILQVVLGYLRAGLIGYYFPNSVIKGMLAGIGVLIILKQIPHAFGYDLDYEGSYTFTQPDGENTISELFHFLGYINIGPTIVAAVSLFILILWEQNFIKKIPIFKIIQGPLVVVVLGILYTVFLGNHETLGIYADHLVQIPVLESLSALPSLFTLPDFTAIVNPQVWVVGATIAVVASLETLLCVEATDKLDPYKRITPTNRELKAQGVGNIVSGLIGGLPVTQVIVRSSANIQSGGKTKMAAIYHGIILMLCVLAIPLVLNMIPLASLAAILLLVGYKLAKPAYFKEMWAKGYTQFAPFVITILAIVLTDLLMGIAIGLGVAILFILYANFRSSYFFDETKYKENEVIHIKFSQEMTFLNKASLLDALKRIPDNASVEIDVRDCTYIDEDIKEMVIDFRENASNRNIDINILKGAYEGQLGGPSIIKNHLKPVEVDVPTI
ncbi:MAG: SulP family inorganic anion transporter [Chitinophagales bacterium]